MRTGCFSLGATLLFSQQAITNAEAINASDALLKSQNNPKEWQNFQASVRTETYSPDIRSRAMLLFAVIETSQKDGMLTLEYYMNAFAQRGLIAQDEIGKYLTEAKRFGQPDLFDPLERSALRRNPVFRPLPFSHCFRIV